MISLLKIELKKIVNYRTFWAATIFYLLLLPLIFYYVGSLKFDIDSGALKLTWMYSFPDIWHALSYFGSWFNLFLSLLVITLVTNEFTFRTARQNIIDGLSRSEFVFAKILLILLFSICVTIFLTLCGFVFGYIFTENVTFDIIKEKIIFIPAFFVQSIGYMIIAMFFGILFKRQGITIILFIIYSIMIEPLISWKLPEKIADFTPVETLSNLINNPFVEKIGITVVKESFQVYLSISIIYIIIFSIISILIMKQSDNIQ